MHLEGQGGRKLIKVPEITIWFWIIKIMMTTVGETAADFLNLALRPEPWLTPLATGTFLSAVLVLQFRARRYVPWVYWLTVLAVSVTGTLLTDSLVGAFGVTLVAASILFTLALLTTLAVWYWRERTLAIHTIYTTRREMFYWTAILMTFALGTAVGDLVSEELRLGYLVSALIFALIVTVVAVAYYAYKLDAISAFWIAYVLTRPLGVSCGDWLSRPSASGGLGFGATDTTAVFLLVILALVALLQFTQRRAA